MHSQMSKEFVQLYSEFGDDNDKHILFIHGLGASSVA